ncbi:hypothetical protein [Thermaerobacter litoralis]
MVGGIQAGHSRRPRAGRGWGRRIALAAVLVLAVLALAACGRGEDRPGSVSVDPESSTPSVSGTGTHSGSASGTHSGSASGTHSGSGSGTHSGSATGSHAHAGAEAGHVEPKPAGASQVDVTLKEWAIEVEPAQVKAGQVYFLVTNAGPVHPHELVIIRSDAEPEELPVVEGRVPEDQVEFVGEVEAFAAGSQASGVFDLEPGRYLLICNIVEGEGEHAVSHFEEGMVAELTVTP